VIDADDPRTATLFLCGDVMTGRGIDHVLSHAGDPRLREGYVKDAAEYVAIAEAANGPVPRPVRDDYIWGEALEELARVQPRALVANLETSVTTSDEYWTGKGIHYRMHPGNVGCLTSARLDVCTLANNHVLDFGAAGLIETLDTLTQAGIRTAGAGRDLAAAQAPAVVPLLSDSRLLVFACGCASSGVLEEWAATASRPGVDLLPNLLRQTAAGVGARVRQHKRTGDVAMVSIHWGDNWGYEVSDAQRHFAHGLIEEGVDVVYGHSSHHPRPIEIHRGRLVLYGCGDFINDYEGISGYEDYRDDLALMYFPTIDTASGALVSLRMVPMQIKRFRLQRASAADTRWLRDRLARCSTRFGTRVTVGEDGALIGSAPTGQ